MKRIDVTHWIEQAAGIGPAMQARILYTALVLCAVWLVRRVLVRAVERHVDDLQARYRWRKSTSYAAAVVVIVAMVRIWFEGFTSLSTVVGLASAGIAIAMRDPLVNLAGWLFILWRQPFAVGDRVEIRGPAGAVAGDVIDQRVFSFTLNEIGNWVRADQSTGRIIHVPNGRVFTETVANYTRGFKYIWDEVGVLVTFESDWRKAKERLTEIVERHAAHLSQEAETRLREASRRYLIFYSKLTPIVYTSVEDSGVMLTMRYLTEPHRRRARRQAIWEDVLDTFAAHDDIDFAYPTTRFYDNRREGKPGTIPKPAGAPTPPVSAPPDPSDGYGPPSG